MSLLDNVSGLSLKKLHSGLRQSHGFSGYESMQMVFNTKEILEVAPESWSEWDLNTRPLNSGQKLKPTELSGHYI